MILMHDEVMPRSRAGTRSQSISPSHPGSAWLRRTRLPFRLDGPSIPSPRCPLARILSRGGIYTRPMTRPPFAAPLSLPDVAPRPRPSPAPSTPPGCTTSTRATRCGTPSPTRPARSRSATSATSATRGTSTRAAPSGSPSARARSPPRRRLGQDVVGLGGGGVLRLDPSLSAAPGLGRVLSLGTTSVQKTIGPTAVRQGKGTSSMHLFRRRHMDQCIFVSRYRVKKKGWLREVKAAAGPRELPCSDGDGCDEMDNPLGPSGAADAEDDVRTMVNARYGYVWLSFSCRWS